MSYMLYMNECLNVSAILFYVMLGYMHLVSIALCKGKKKQDYMMFISAVGLGVSWPRLWMARTCDRTVSKLLDSLVQEKFLGYDSARGPGA